MHCIKNKKLTRTNKTKPMSWASPKNVIKSVKSVQWVEVYDWKDLWDKFLAWKETVKKVNNSLLHKWQMNLHYSITKKIIHCCLCLWVVVRAGKGHGGGCTWINERALHWFHRFYDLFQTCSAHCFCFVFSC